jgi:serine protease Do
MEQLRNTGFRACLLACLLALGSSALAEPRTGQPTYTAPVLGAFSEVIQQAAKSTVQVYADGHVVALGAIVRGDGYIVTKSSELNGKLEVKFNDPRNSRKYDATFVASDKATDLALLKVEARNLPTLAWSDEPPPAVGSWLATPGLDSAKEPLAIGVLSVAVRKINAAAGALGIFLDDADDIAKIREVRENSAASQAGLLAGDIIRQINGKVVKSRQHGQETIRSYQPGEQVELLIDRNGNELKIKATLGSLANLMQGERADYQNTLGGKLSDRRSGFPTAIQHDTVLRPSDCGGPIVDLDGKAVGLNIARAGRVESYALPAALVRETVEKLLQPQLTSTPAGDKLIGKTEATAGEKKVH